MINPHKMKRSRMTLKVFVRILSELEKEIGGHLEIWLSSDEEGNEFLPMLPQEKLSLGYDEDNKRIILFPSHR